MWYFHKSHGECDLIFRANEKITHTHKHKINGVPQKTNHIVLLDSNFVVKSSGGTSLDHAHNCGLEMNVVMGVMKLFECADSDCADAIYM